MSRGNITLKFEQEIAFVCFDNPRARNAMSRQMMQQLPGVLRELKSYAPKVVILSGADQHAFCAGGDLRDVRQSLIDSEQGRIMCEQMTKNLDLLLQLPAFVIAAVEGAALGGGAEVLTACDALICGESATIGFVHASLGVSPGWGGGRRLIQQIGRKKALQLLATAVKLSAHQAQEMGFVDEVVSDGTTLTAAVHYAKRVCRVPKAALTGVIELVNQPDREPQIFTSLWGESAHRKALGILS